VSPSSWRLQTVTGKGDKVSLAFRPEKVAISRDGNPLLQ
jgi:hypothetical protein